MHEFTGDKDLDFVPKDENVLNWRFFCSDMYSKDRKYKEVEDICERFGHKTIDLRPYFIESPYTVQTTDKLPKCLELFRTMHSRALPVNDPNTGITVGMLTRQDIFAYMAL
jgi:CBS domain containing-hemolysin-like protein